MNKRGAEMTVGTLVVIVLAIIVLVVLALGFGTGWGNLWSKISGYFSPVNVDSIKQSCQYAATTQASFDYCCRIREVKFDADGVKTKLTCADSRVSGDADITCDKSICSSVVCEGSWEELIEEGAKKKVTTLFEGNKVEKTAVDDVSCLAKDVDATRLFTKNMEILDNKNMVCCKKYTEEKD